MAKSSPILPGSPSKVISPDLMALGNVVCLTRIELRVDRVSVNPASARAANFPRTMVRAEFSKFRANFSPTSLNVQFMTSVFASAFSGY